jgi:hypothetical protein
MNYISENAGPGARVYSETPLLAKFHAQRYGRDDLVSVWLSDPSELQQMRPGDFVIDARGRRYLSNDEKLKRLENIAEPDATIYLGDTPAVNIYRIGMNEFPLFQNSAN